MKNEHGVELNNRGIPARKRKKNSLIYGADDLVSIPVKSPKKRVVQKPTKEPEKVKREVAPKVKRVETDDDEDEDIFDDDNDNLSDSLDKSVDFYEENMDDPDSPPPHEVKTPKKMTEEVAF